MIVHFWKWYRGSRDITVKGFSRDLRSGSLPANLCLVSFAEQRQTTTQRQQQSRNYNNADECADRNNLFQRPLPSLFGQGPENGLAARMAGKCGSNLERAGEHSYCPFMKL